MSSQSNYETRADICAFYTYLVVGFTKYTAAYSEMATTFLSGLPVDLGAVHEGAFILYAILNLRQAFMVWLERRRK